MLMRALLLLFLCANALVWAYGQGWLAAVGWPLQELREPHRLAQQVAPEALRLLPNQGQAPVTGHSAASAMVPQQPPQRSNPQEAAACWQWTGLPAAVGVPLRAALAATLPADPKAWALEAVTLPGRWIVYLGPFPSVQAQQQRRNALRNAGLDVRTVTTPGLQPGLALGTYSSPQAGQRALRDARTQGVQDAKVVQERPETQAWNLRLPAITDQQLDLVQALPMLAGQPRQPCP